MRPVKKGASRLAWPASASEGWSPAEARARHQPPKPARALSVLGVRLMRVSVPLLQLHIGEHPSRHTSSELRQSSLEHHGALRLMRSRSVR